MTFPINFTPADIQNLACALSDENWEALSEAMKQKRINANNKRRAEIEDVFTNTISALQSQLKPNEELCIWNKNADQVIYLYFNTDFTVEVHTF